MPLRVLPHLPDAPTSYHIDMEALKQKTANFVDANQFTGGTYETYDSSKQVQLSDDEAFTLSDRLAFGKIDAEEWENHYKSSALTLKSIQQDLASTTYDGMDGNVYYQNFSAHVSPLYNYGDGYINNLIVKASFYRSQIHNNFEGIDQEKRLSGLDDTVNGLIDKFAKTTASRISDNGIAADLGILPNQIKTDIVSMYKENSEKMEKLISGNEDKWQTVLKTGGDYLNYFRQKLETATTAKSSAIDSNTAKQLSYSGLKDVLTTMYSADEDLRNNQTYSSEQLAFFNGKDNCQTAYQLISGMRRGVYDSTACCSFSNGQYIYNCYISGKVVRRDNTDKPEDINLIASSNYVERLLAKLRGSSIFA